MRALITDIQRFSLHDGPGVRTTVFLKGCPLRCSWCHNPEAISYEKQILSYPEKCIGCGKCEEGCYSGARVICGREMSVEDVLAEVMRDRAYYGETGGITLSGGEPLAHPQFSAELLKRCREEGIHTAIETSLYRFDESVISLCDLVMTDVKMWDTKLHEQFIGVGNDAILKNIRAVDSMGIPMIIRTPVISGINDSEDNIKSTAEFVRTLKHAHKYELLPYHPLGLSKAKALGIEMQRFEAPSKNKMEELRKYADIC